MKDASFSALLPVAAISALRPVWGRGDPLLLGSFYSAPAAAAAAILICDSRLRRGNAKQTSDNIMVRGDNSDIDLG